MYCENKETPVFELRMDPDFGSLFYDSEGACCGNSRFVLIDEGDKKDIEIDLSSVDGLDKWLTEYEEELFEHKYHWSESDWNAWWLRGRELAKRVKELLPPHVHLTYRVSDFGINMQHISYEDVYMKDPSPKFID